MEVLTGVFRVTRAGNSIKSALKKASEYFKSDNVILISEQVGALDAVTFLNHKKYFYISLYKK